MDTAVITKIKSEGIIKKLSKENIELKLAIKAIVAGELALSQGNTRTFKSFLKSLPPKHAPDYKISHHSLL